jgi:aspartyl-tRNA(Asn)/glutamyl-tRNA(Gln) amidotransferase subunit A
LSSARQVQAKIEVVIRIKGNDFKIALSDGFLSLDMSAKEIGFLTATELKRLYQRLEISPVEVVKATIQHVDVMERGGLNAMARVTEDLALHAARSAETRYLNGTATGLLEGIPITIKDQHLTRGIPTEFGSRTTKGNIPIVDEPCVTRLYSAGAVMLGKTTVSEFSWKAVSDSPLTGITHNPWKKGYNAGASSAGAAAGAAAGYGPLHQGSDGAGSIRIPAHFCGVFGFKPTFGRIPLWPISNNDQATHIGALTRSVADAALMLEAMAGPHPWDHMSCEAPPMSFVRDLSADMRGKRIAYSANLGHARVDPEVAELVLAAVRVFEEMGAAVTEISPQWGHLGPDLIRFFWPTVFLARARGWQPRHGEMDPGLVAMMEASMDVTAEEFMTRRLARWSYVKEIHTTMEEWDLLLTPAASVAAFPVSLLQPTDWPRHDWNWMEWAPFCYPFNMAGNPAASCPCGLTSDGLPVGLQIVGKRFADLEVLQASYAFERTNIWKQRRPPIADF